MEMTVKAARLCVLLIAVTTYVWSEEVEKPFRAGFAKRDITPSESVPLWGYDAENRPDNLSKGVLDPLNAKCVVIQAGDKKLAIVGLDLGRAPNEPLIKSVRDEVSGQYGIDFLLLCASHTHHGPAMEFEDRDGYGRGPFDASIRYYKELRQKLVDVIGEASTALTDARIGFDTKQCLLNRNRHSQIEPIPCDRDLTVIRIDDDGGNILALLVNYQAHPTVHPPQNNKFTAEFPGVMMAAVEKELSTNCIFIQGAAGDLQCEMDDDLWGEKDFIQEIGLALAKEVIDMAPGIQITRPASPSLVGDRKRYTCSLRLDFSQPGLREMYAGAFTPELTNCFFDKYADGEMHPRLSTVLLNDNLYFVGASGEFFCEHAQNLKSRIRDAKVVFAGYCNGHDMYFPTIKGAAEGGYGADPGVAWAALGTAERMMDDALIQFYKYRGRFEDSALNP
ncbi:MAG: hypothetical protein AMXMBFR84_24800 [Candidatus Hydrogenedentota bacterium]